MNDTPLHSIPVAPLTQTGFARFGDVVATDGTAPLEINQGFADRFNDLARIDVEDGNGRASISIFTARARPQPIAIKLMERHPLGSQLFYPLQDASWLVLVCEEPREWKSYRAFLATGQQGVNYAKNIWHHPLLVTGDTERFIVIDRAGPGNNLEELWLDMEQNLQIAMDEKGNGALS